MVSGSRMTLGRPVAYGPVHPDLDAETRNPMTGSKKFLKRVTLAAIRQSGPVWRRLSVDIQICHSAGLALTWLF